MSARRVHLRINNDSLEPAPAFFVTACGIKHLHSGNVLGDAKRQAESVRPDQFDGQIRCKVACKRCTLQWKNDTWRLK